MKPLPPLTDEEYAAVKAVLAQVEAAKANGVDVQELLERMGQREGSDIIAVMRAAAEGYEAARGNS